MKKFATLFLCLTIGSAFASDPDVYFSDLEKRHTTMSDNPSFFEKMMVNECTPLQGCRRVLKKVDLLHPEMQEATFHLREGISWVKAFEGRCTNKTSDLDLGYAYYRAKNHLGAAEKQPVMRNKALYWKDRLQRNRFRCMPSPS